MISLTHEKNIICSQTQLDDIAHEQTIIAVICRSRGGLSVNEKEEKFASNENVHCATDLENVLSKTRR